MMYPSDEYEWTLWMALGFAAGFGLAATGWLS